MKNTGEVREIINSFSPPPLSTIEISVSDSSGRVLAESVWAASSVPHYNAAAMDGIAVASVDTFGASEGNPVRFLSNQYKEVDTGDQILHPHNVVIPAEEVTYKEDSVLIFRSFSPWSNIRSVGEDMVKGELLAPANTIVNERMIPLLIAGGIKKVKVKKRPQVCIIPTGEEIVRLEDISSLEPGKIIDFNSFMCDAYLKKLGCECYILQPIEDKPEVLERVIKKELEKHDFLIIIGGTSAGRDDYTSMVTQKLGNVLVHGVKMMPGKPFFLGKISKKAIFGLPGYAGSAYFCLHEFIRNYVENLLGIKTPLYSLSCTLSESLPSKAGYDEYIRVNLSEIGGKILALPLKRGASILKSLTEADGYFVIPSEKEGISAGEEVSVRVFDRNPQIDKNIIFCGSNDFSIDILKDMAKTCGFNITSLNRGSLGGLTSLKNFTTHFAPTHLLDTETGEYNDTFIKKMFREDEVSLLHLARRTQGIIVKKGNPLRIKNIKDAVKARLVNRQKGSGTRVLLDYLLQKEGIKKEEIQGYENELFTHLAICDFIFNGNADWGMGIAQAARAFGLDFIPVAEESYELAFYSNFQEDKRFCLVYNIIKDKEFKKRLKSLTGYNTEKTPTIRKVV